MQKVYDPQKKISKLKSIANRSYEIGKIERTLQAVSACSEILYKYNQVYKDDELENLLLKISEKLVKLDNPKSHSNNKKIVMFYDGFGVDRRGIAIVTCRAIASNGYKLIYVSPKKTYRKQKMLEKVLEKHDVEWKYLDTNASYVLQIAELKKIFCEKIPDVSFFYSKPYDVSGIVVFNALKNHTFRYQLDLTDHAFWLGINVFDICCGGREYSASIQHFYRGIPKEKMCLLDADLFIDELPLQELPFNPDEKFIFSGGQLYKTLGDVDRLYYKIVDHILNKHTDVKFLYAGDGDKNEILKLSSKFPGRVFLISERADFYRIMEKCTLYLNTYPMFGGLMMRYAAMAGKIPITLKHGKDADGILIDQSKRKIEYESYSDLVEDVDKLLSDNEYLKEREKLMDGSVITEKVYKRNIKLMVEEHRTEFHYKHIKKIDTIQFRKEFKERFLYKDVAFPIGNRRHMQLIPYFPKEFIYSFYKKIYIQCKRRSSYK